MAWWYEEVHAELEKAGITSRVEYVADRYWVMLEIAHGHDFVWFDQHNGLSAWGSNFDFFSARSVSEMVSKIKVAMTWYDELQAELEKAGVASSISKHNRRHCVTLGATHGHDAVWFDPDIHRFSWGPNFDFSAKSVSEVVLKIKGGEHAKI